MRFLVDEMPDNKRDCPFFIGTCYINDCTMVKDYCKHTKKSCDLNIRTGCRTTCSGLSIITNDKVVRYD